jgi:hypothetical protein
MMIELRKEHNMQAFHADPAIKQQLLAQLKAHAQAGEILNRANAWQDGKGGPVACLVHDTDLVVWQERTGMPKAVGAALDAAASHLAEPAQAAQFALEWLEAVAVGQDLRGVAPALIDWLLTDAEVGLWRSAESAPVQDMIGRIADLQRRVAADDAPPEAEWRAARAATLAVTDGCERPVEKALARAAEVAAWNPATSASVVADTVLAWVNMFSLRMPWLVGRGAKLTEEIKAWMAELKAEAEQAGLPAPNISERDLCEKHPAVVALRRLQTDEIKQGQREDRQRLTKALLAITRQSAGALIGA